MNQLLKRCFYGRAWDIAFRYISKNEPLPQKAESEYTLIESSNNEWYADPFCVKNEEKYYVFFELMKLWRGLGSIGVVEICGNSVTKVTEVLRESFHLSYPNVFRWNNQMYMIPESGRAKQLRLYRAKEFPYQWTLDTILCENVELVDTSIMQQDNSIYLFSYCKGHPEKSPIIFILDMQNRCLKRLDNIVSACGMQSGGNTLSFNNACYRPLQDSSIRYGEKLLIYKMLSYPYEGYLEKFHSVIDVNSVKLIDGHHSYDALHTINRCDGMEVIDVGYTRFYPIKIIQHIVQRYVKSRSY